jgi:hypothetical protein
MLMSFWKIITNSRKVAAPVVTVACAREAVLRPRCVRRFDDERADRALVRVLDRVGRDRPVEPNSMGVATPRRFVGRDIARRTTGM